ncbi:putative amidohydrolase [Mesorhizobium jarvisii]
MQFDLLLKGGRLIDPASGIDALRDVAIANGRVAAVDADIPADRAAQVVDVTGCIVAPGLVDLHSHVYWGGTSLGVDADRLAAKSGTTTFIDAGSAGAGNFLGFRRHVMERSRARILAYVNISFAGIFGFSQSVSVGECSDLRLCEPREVVAAGARARRCRRRRESPLRQACRRHQRHRAGRSGAGGGRQSRTAADGAY